MGIRDESDYERMQSRRAKDDLLRTINTMRLRGEWETSNWQIAADTSDLDVEVARLRLVMRTTETILRLVISEARQSGASWQTIANATGHASASAAQHYFDGDDPIPTRERERILRLRKIQ